MQAASGLKSVLRHNRLWIFLDVKQCICADCVRVFTSYLRLALMTHERGAQANRKPLYSMAHLCWISIHHASQLRAAFNNRCAWSTRQSKGFIDRQDRKSWERCFRFFQLRASYEPQTEYVSPANAAARFNLYSINNASPRQTTSHNLFPTQVAMWNHNISTGWQNGRPSLSASALISVGKIKSSLKRPPG